MVTLIVPEQYNSKKLDRFLKEQFPRLPQSAMFKAIRTKNIRVNGLKINENISVSAGDKLDIYIKDEILYGKPLENINPSDRLDIIFEDDNLLIVNKKPGISVHPDKDPNEETLIDLAVSYLKAKNGHNAQKGNLFTPSLCHRLDRNTGGLVIIAKTPQALETMLEKIKNREVKKYYKCVVIGCPKSPKAELRHYLVKDTFKSRVFISDEKKPGAVEIITKYKVLSSADGMSLLEVELVTGKTHQIRAHLAHIGHPIVGDGKYGSEKFNRQAGAKYQALWAYKIVFDFKDGGTLSYLKGKVFETDSIDFKIKNADEKLFL